MRREIVLPELKYTGTWIPLPSWAQDSSNFLVALPPLDSDPLVDYTVPAQIKIWSISADGSEMVEIASEKAELSDVSFSPDLEKISLSDNTHLWIIDLSGKILTEVSATAEDSGMHEVYFLKWSPDSEHFTYLAGDNTCACGYDKIANLIDQERLRLHDETCFSGYVTGFITWLDAESFIFYSYPPQDNFSGVLTLGDLEGGEVTWPSEEENPVVDWWIP